MKKIKLIGLFLISVIGAQFNVANAGYSLNSFHNDVLPWAETYEFWKAFHQTSVNEIVKSDGLGDIEYYMNLIIQANLPNIPVENINLRIKARELLMKYCGKISVDPLIPYDLCVSGRLGPDSLIHLGGVSLNSKLMGYLTYLYSYEQYHKDRIEACLNKELAAFSKTEKSTPYSYAVESNTDLLENCDEYGSLKDSFTNMLSYTYVNNKTNGSANGWYESNSDATTITDIENIYYNYCTTDLSLFDNSAQSTYCTNMGALSGDSSYFNAAKYLGKSVLNGASGSTSGSSKSFLDYNTYQKDQFFKKDIPYTAVKYYNGGTKQVHDGWTTNYSNISCSDSCTEYKDQQDTSSGCKTWEKTTGSYTYCTSTPSLFDGLFSGCGGKTNVSSSSGSGQCPSSPGTYVSSYSSKWKTETCSDGRSSSDGCTGSTSYTHHYTYTYNDVNNSKLYTKSGAQIPNVTYIRSGDKFNVKYPIVNINEYTFTDNVFVKVDSNLKFLPSVQDVISADFGYNCENKEIDIYEISDFTQSSLSKNWTEYQSKSGSNSAVKVNIPSSLYGFIVGHQSPATLLGKYQECTPK